MDTQVAQPAQKNTQLLSIGDLFAKSWNLYKSKAFSMLALILLGCFASLVVVLVCCMVGAIIFLILKKSFMVYPWISLIFLLGILLVVIINLWMQVALFYAVKEASGNIDIKSLLKEVKPNIAPYFWVVFLRSLLVMLGFLLLIIPGIIFSIWFSFSQYVFVSEGLTGMKALNRSKELVKGYFWEILARMLILGIVGGIISMVPVVGKLAAILFVMPFSITYLYVLCEDLRRIK